MVKVCFEINEMTDPDECEFDTYDGRIDTDELIGAEILAVSTHQYGDDDEVEEIDELEIRLKDGRVVNICGDNIIVNQWSEE
ncbi:MAG: hypothetical protein PHD34_04620 [Methanothrix soehngenii]|nr:hypothetical protein [Methanothrix soehngenii]